MFDKIYDHRIEEANCTTVLSRDLSTLISDYIPDPCGNYDDLAKSLTDHSFYVSHAFFFLWYIVKRLHENYADTRKK